MTILRFACLAAALPMFVPAAVSAQNGGIAGVITRASDAVPLAGITVSLYSEIGSQLASTLTAGDGSYSFPSRPAGLYRVYASPNTISGTAYLGAGYNGLVCSTNCSITSFTPVAIAVNQTTTGINFSLRLAAQVSGTVTSTVGGAPIATARVELHTAAGLRAWVYTNASGLYHFDWLPADTYFVKTAKNSEHIDEIYSNQLCDPLCNAQTGNPIVVADGSVVAGIDFALVPNGAGPPNGVIAGAMKSAATNTPIAFGSVDVFNTAGFIVESVLTAADGSYSLSLPPGTYFARTSLHPQGEYRNRLFDNIYCSITCDPTSGTPIIVTSNQLSTVNFLVPPAGGISGTVRSSATGAPLGTTTVWAYRIDGQGAGSDTTLSDGTYSMNLLPGYYFVRATPPGAYRGELYDDIACLGSCAVTAGTPVAVADTVFTTVDFALNPGGNIAGTITAYPSGQPLSPVVVSLYTPTGELVSSTSTNSGSYVMSAPAGSYVLAASRPGYGTRLFNDISCSAPCAVTSGTPLIVSAGATSVADFQMRPTGTLSGVVRKATTLAPLGEFAEIEVYSPNGAFVAKATVTNATGVYSAELGEGSYRVRTRLSSSSSFADEVYNDVHCGAPCDLQAGALVTVVSGTTTAGIDFTLETSGGISGAVTQALNDQGLGSVQVGVYGQDGSLVATALSSQPSGAYTVRVPTGTYFVAANPGFSGSGQQNFVQMLYASQACLPACTPTVGTPVVVTTGTTTPNINFALDPGGMVTGRVADAGTGQPLGAFKVGLYTANGVLVKATSTSATGDYAFSQLSAGNFFVRTIASGAYVDEVYNGQTLCFLQCAVTSGTPVPVVPGQITAGIDFALSSVAELLQNGAFVNGTAGWSLFATPTTEHLVRDVENAVFRFTRIAPPPGATNQALIFQNTGVALPAGTPLLAQFDLGSAVLNTSAMPGVRKRVSVLVHDADFSDLAVCTFWLPASTTSSSRHGVRMVTTKAWTNATIGFYAATATSKDEAVTLDNVSLQAMPGAAVERTECVLEGGVRAPGGADSAELLLNGDFSSGAVAPGWGTFGQIQGQVTGGVFEFIKLAGAPAGVVLQQTGQPVTAAGILTARFDLGNSSGVRKRATVILHDNNFSDLAACTFWLDPGQSLGGFTMRIVATKAWANATISVYPATAGADQWIRLDNVSLKHTPGAITTGTTCLEPAGTGGDSSTPRPRGVTAAEVAPGIGAADVDPQISGPGPSQATAGAAPLRDADISDPWIADGFIGDDTTAPPRIWLGVASASTSLTLTRSAPIDDAAPTLVLRLRSWLTSTRGSRALVEISADGVAWETIHSVQASDGWTPLDIDLEPHRGSASFVRLRFEAVPVDSGEPDVWRVDVD